jgi:hypothetical protein
MIVGSLAIALVILLAVVPQNRDAEADVLQALVASSG